MTGKDSEVMKTHLIQAALGECPADLLLKNAQVVDVFTGTIFPADIAVADGIIAGVGRYTEARQTVDLRGCYVSPGLINAHCHVESSMAVPAVYCAEELRWGVTTLITDPHEIANVAGLPGIRFMLEASEGLPVNYYVMLPSCVPATPFEHAGCVLSGDELLELAGHPRVLGLGEMMNLPGVLGCDEAVLHKLECFSKCVIDGHAPQAHGRQLQAYAAAGIHTDHESISYGEAREKLRAGMAVLVREGSASRNLEAILSGVLAEEIFTDRLAFCTDDKHLADLRREGSIRWCVKKAVALGMNPVTALQIATINAARIYNLPNLGAVAPGKQADLVVFDDLRELNVLQVYQKGQLVADAEGVHFPSPVEGDGLLVSEPIAAAVEGSVRLASFTAEQLAPSLEPERRYPVIEMLPHEIATEKGACTGAKAMEELERGELCRIAVLERHHATGHIGCGLLRGFGLREGAVATTVAHDSHNLIVAGTNAVEMAVAVRELERVQGGYTLVRGGQVLDTLPLPVAGLMSRLSADELNARLRQISTRARELGIAEDVDPFITLSFMALPVIPKLRITDSGMFDVEKFAFCG